MSRFEVAPGFSLNVETWGEGAPLVLLHGFTGSSRAWAEFGELLGRSFRCIAVDLVGHGDSDAPGDLWRYRIEQAAADAVAAVRSLGVERGAWLGYSMGGRTAVAVACTRPEAVSALVTIGASPGIADEAERTARRRADDALADRIEQEGIEAFVAYWESLPLWASQARLPAVLREAQRAVRLANAPRGLANSLRGMGAGAQPPFHDALRRLRVPFLALAGELDSKYARAAAEMATLVPRGRVEIIAGAGHAAQLEAPAQTAAAVTRFLAHSIHLPLEASP